MWRRTTFFFFYFFFFSFFNYFMYCIHTIAATQPISITFSACISAFMSSNSIHCSNARNSNYNISAEFMRCTKCCAFYHSYFRWCVEIRQFTATYIVMSQTLDKQTRRTHYLIVGNVTYMIPFNWTNWTCRKNIHLNYLWFILCVHLYAFGRDSVSNQMPSIF